LIHFTLDDSAFDQPLDWMRQDLFSANLDKSMRLCELKGVRKEVHEDLTDALVVKEEQEPLQLRVHMHPVLLLLLLHLDLDQLEAPHDKILYASGNAFDLEFP
jgi:hypothetical protein